MYPSGDLLPENLLRFYIYFSEPMQRSNTLDFIGLVDEKSGPVSGAFLANRFQFWSPDGRRLTLLFDPGRVKTGLVAHSRLGRALEASSRYRLMIDRNLLSARGCAPAGRFNKPFRAGPADFDPPDPDAWIVKKPQTGTRDPLSIMLNGPHDHVSLAYGLRVKDSVGRTVRGRIDLAMNETQWTFTPKQVWQAREYKVAINPIVEDIAGNRLTGSFERPIDTAADEAGNHFHFIAFTPISD